MDNGSVIVADRGSAASAAPMFIEPRLELEGEHDEGDAEDERVGAEPPGQHHRADHRRDDKQRAVDQRGEVRLRPATSDRLRFRAETPPPAPGPR